MKVAHTPVSLFETTTVDVKRPSTFVWCLCVFGVFFVTTSGLYTCLMFYTDINYITDHLAAVPALSNSTLVYLSASKQSCFADPYGLGDVVVSVNAYNSHKFYSDSLISRSYYRSYFRAAQHLTDECGDLYYYPLQFGFTLYTWLIIVVSLKFFMIYFIIKFYDLYLLNIHLSNTVSRTS